MVNGEIGFHIVKMLIGFMIDFSKGKVSSFYKHSGSAFTHWVRSETKSSRFNIKDLVKIELENATVLCFSEPLCFL